MENNMDELTKHISRFLTGFCVSQAILEDYAKVVAKIENVAEEDVKKRINERADEIMNKVKAEHKPE